MGIMSPPIVLIEHVGKNFCLNHTFSMRFVKLLWVKYSGPHVLSFNPSNSGLRTEETWRNPWFQVLSRFLSPFPISIHFCIRRVILGSQWLRGKDCTKLMADYEKVAKERRKQILQLQDWNTVPGGLMDWWLQFHENFCGSDFSRTVVGAPYPNWWILMEVFSIVIAIDNPSCAPHVASRFGTCCDGRLVRTYSHPCSSRKCIIWQSYVWETHRIYNWEQEFDMDAPSVLVYIYVYIIHFMSRARFHLKGAHERLQAMLQRYGWNLLEYTDPIYVHLPTAPLARTWPISSLAPQWVLGLASRLACWSSNR